MVSSFLGSRCFFSRTEMAPSSSALGFSLPPPIESPLALRGVAIAFLIEFTNKHACWHWTTSRVVNELIIPATSSRAISSSSRTSASRNGVSFAELPEMRHSPHVGRAETFVSHCHGALWSTLVSALADGGALHTRCVWLDVFALPFGESCVERVDLGGVIRSCACHRSEA